MSLCYKNPRGLFFCKHIDFLWMEKDEETTLGFYNWEDFSKEEIKYKGEIQPFLNISIPNICDDYYFGGAIQQSKDSYNKRIDGCFVSFHCEYLREVEEGKYYEFQVMPGNNMEPINLSLLQGLSGAPIFDSNYNLVSLLAG